MKRIFSFELPMKKKVVRNLKIVTEEVGTLLIEGTGTLNKHIPVTNPYDRYTVEIESVRFNGEDIMPVMEWSGMLDDVQEEAVIYFASVCEAYDTTLFSVSSFKEVNQN